MPDVTPAPLREARKMFLKNLEAWDDLRNAMPIVKPPTCGICEKRIDAARDRYRVGIDGEWAHERHFRSVSAKITGAQS